MQLWTLLRNVWYAAVQFRYGTVLHTRVNSILETVEKIPSDEEYKTRRNVSRKNSEFQIAVRDFRHE
jgi:hypothetical protein